jgi:hypothetical protein
MVQHFSVLYVRKYKIVLTIVLFYLLLEPFTILMQGSNSLVE